MLLLVVSKKFATSGWSIEGNNLFDDEDVFDEFSKSKRDVEALFGMCEDGNDGYAIYAGGQGCMTIDDSDIVPQETSELSMSIQYVTKVIIDYGEQYAKGEQGEEITIVETIIYCGEKQCKKGQEN
ncbi:unnamed protein product [Candida verbasci]|uniref:Uncharacterized protein n=1 Tax=Candida verbasci TaxID=1227364 RepID=A0A9W4XA02_9ASCO|nr:unnamed protein product [Candida verbasci]